MSRFKTGPFSGKSHVFLVAIHVGENQRHAAFDVRVAYDEGADGVFCVNQDASDHMVKEACVSARELYPGWFVGANFLGLSGAPMNALSFLPKGWAGIWLDNTFIKEDAPEPCEMLQHTRTYQRLERKDTLLFGSVAFKYQRPVRSPARVARFAEPFVDVIVTSGDATGVAADVEKIRSMRTAVETPLALASGVASNNVQQYIDLGVDVFIVNSAISDKKTKHLDYRLVRELRNKIPR